MKNFEIEFKYSAERITLAAFEDFCRKSTYEKYLQISGYDSFYGHRTDPTQFLRCRVGENSKQLTFKKKLDAQNVIRTEHNLDLATSTSVITVASFCHSLGYEYDTTLYKTCFIYEYLYYTLVYYVCYNEELKEVGRFIEIEMKEDYPFTTEKEAFSELVIVEKLCKSLGIGPANRVVPSLYELYRKNHAES